MTRSGPRIPSMSNTVVCRPGRYQHTKQHRNHHHNFRMHPPDYNNQNYDNDSHYFSHTTNKFTAKAPWLSPSARDFEVWTELQSPACLFPTAGVLQWRRFDRSQSASIRPATRRAFESGVRVRGSNNPWLYQTGIFVVTLGFFFFLHFLLDPTIPPAVKE